ncbi:hypothetical protein EIP91_009980 [Steccherinum ochraceum]|uniref:IBR domain-containing protein n=1 Tax=Steccherinum ochraceum TaxID=92696 RepID=A0A4R0RM74_9APHY|nr:hypothetical protein EIP91_009980 [Steccherinum ochraceum]
MATDVLSELLIAQLLEEDMRMLNSQQEAESLQVTQALADSARGKGRIPKRAQKEATPDGDLAMRLMAEEARLSSDAALAQSLQHTDDAHATANRQFALRLAASEKKVLLDAEFARRLQEADDEMDIDAQNMKDAESVLGRDAIEQIIAGDLNNKGKGKEEVKRELSPEQPRQAKRIKKEKAVVRIKEEEDVDVAMQHHQYPTCGICMDPFQATHSPVSAANYIKTKLDPNDDGSGSPNATVFPIACPECPTEKWIAGISDDVASRVLSEKMMTLWVIVELTMGCNHITCRCGTHFCFKCGSLWDVKNTKCLRVPSCDLWDENMLLEERERERDQRRGGGQRAAPAPRVAHHAPPPPYFAHAPAVHHNQYNDLDWMVDREFLCARHFFTANMISTLSSGLGLDDYNRLVTTDILLLERPILVDLVMQRNILHGQQAQQAKHRDPCHNLPYL